MLQQLRAWLGPKRTRLLIGLLSVAGLVNLVFQGLFHDQSWRLTAQLGIIWLLLAGLGLVLGSRLSQSGQRRLWLALGPGLLLVGVSLLFPAQLFLFSGAGLGWMVTAQFVLRSRVRMEYQAAIRHLRRSEYEPAIEIMDSLIQAEPDSTEHHRFRAELHRLSGHLQRAVSDYERIIKLDETVPTGYTGLAEVYTQQQQYSKAREYALAALERVPQQWIVSYNLGLIEDRLAEPDAAIEHLEQALAAGLPHRRYRVLAQLWLVRNHARLGHTAAAQQQLELMRQQAHGLEDWQTLFESEQAAALRELLAADVALAQRLLAGEVGLGVFGVG